MSRKSRKNVGVIGLGIIGGRVAAGLRAAGYQVYVWNRSARPAPNFLGSPAEIAEAANIIQIFVSDAAALFEVLEGMSDALTANHVIICSATVGPEAVLEAAQIVESKGAQFLDAPFTGSKGAAEKRQLVYYIGGSEHTFLKAKPILEVTSKAMVRIGEVGHAASVKVVTNMISAVTTQVLAEALSIIQKAGLQPEVLIAAIEHNACRSGVVDLKLPKMIAGDFEPHFSLKHMFKDVQLGIHMANALDIEIPTTTVTAGVMYGALNQGWGDLDYSSVFKNYITPEPEEELPALTHGALSPMSPEDVFAEEGRGREFIEEVGPPKLAMGDMGGDDREESPSMPGTISLGTPADILPAGESNEPAVAPKIDAVPSPTDNQKSAEGNTPEPSIKEISAKEIAPGEPPPAEKEAESPDGKAAIGESPATDATAKAANADTPGENAAEPVVAPKNFVRRWFVARSGS